MFSAAIHVAFNISNEGFMSYVMQPVPAVTFLLCNNVNKRLNFMSTLLANMLPNNGTKSHVTKISYV